MNITCIVRKTPIEGTVLSGIVSLLVYMDKVLLIKKEVFLKCGTDALFISERRASIIQVPSSKS